MKACKLCKHSLNMAAECFRKSLSLTLLFVPVFVNEIFNIQAASLEDWNLTSLPCWYQAPEGRLM